MIREVALLNLIHNLRVSLDAVGGAVVRPRDVIKP
jgi:hypothetical protein